MSDSEMGSDEAALVDCVVRGDWGQAKKGAGDWPIFSGKEVSRQDAETQRGGGENGVKDFVKRV